MAINFYQLQLTSFLQEYLLIPKAGYNPDGSVSAPFVRLGIDLLLQEKVFDDGQDLQRTAYSDYGILIPTYADIGFSERTKE